MVNKVLLAGDKIMSEIHLGKLVDHLLRTEEEYKNLKKQEIHDIFIKRN